MCETADKKIDLLNREKFIRFLENLIMNAERYKRNTETRSYVLALDSSWGTGKSYLLDLFDEQTQDNIITIRYNAWTNDFWDNAFEPLMQSILSDKNFCSSIDTVNIEGLGKSLVEAAILVGKGFVKTKVQEYIGEDTMEALLNKDVAGKFVNYLTGDIKLFDELREFKDNIDLLKKTLAYYIDSVDKKKRLVIVIDELDRCRPTFAVQTLEIVKHIFDVPNLIFLFSLDIEQLSHSVKSVYGLNMDSVGYLCRFFDYIAKLPIPNASLYIKKSILKIKVPNTTIPNYREEDSHASIKFEKAITIFLSDMYRHFDLSLRDLDTILQSYYIMFDYFLYKYKMIGAHFIYLFYITLKYKQPEIFNNIFIRKLKKHPNEFLRELGIVENFIGEYIWINQSVEFLNSPLKLSKIEFSIECDQKGISNSQPLKIASVKNGSLNYTDRTDFGIYTRSVSLSPTESVSNVLFEPDLNNWDEIKNLTYKEFIHNQLEMYNFINEISISEEDFKDMQN